MVDDRPEETGSLPDSERPKREPPTIDLEATEVSTEPQAAAAATAAEPQPESVSEAPAAPAPQPVSSWIVAPLSGAVAAALVIGVGWMLGWPPIQPASAPQPNAAIDGLTARIAGLESKSGKAVADPAAAARTEALEKSLAALRTELAATRAQGEKLASAINDVKVAPRADGPVGSPDLSAIDERIAKVESLIQMQITEIAQQGSKIA